MKGCIVDLIGNERLIVDLIGNERLYSRLDET